MCAPATIFHFLLFFLSNLGELETVMKTISHWQSLSNFAQAPMWISYDGCYDNQGLQKKYLRNRALDIFPAQKEHLSMHQLKIGRAVNFVLRVNFSSLLGSKISLVGV